MLLTLGGSDPGRGRLSFAEAADIDEFVSELGRYERGEISAAEWRRFRLVRGTYGQRQDDALMLRVKIPQGLLDAAQLESLADVAAAYSRGFAHVTTRQNVQLHFLELHEAEDAQRRLAATGLTTREACGNAVRNITGCPYAGVASDEAFDATPYAEALTRYLLRHPLSSVLPRKFKIAFEACPVDHALTGINDIGYRGFLDAEGTRRFRVSVGGGTSILCRGAAPLVEDLAATDVLHVAEATMRIFHRHGDFEHPRRNRMKFLIESMGQEAFRETVLAELETVRAEGCVPRVFEDVLPAEEGPPGWARPAPPDPALTARRVDAVPVKGPGLPPDPRAPLSAEEAGFERWRGNNVRPQRQAGFNVATVRLVLGDVTAGQLRGLAALARAFGDGTVRLTPDQNLVLRWVADEELAGLHRQLLAAGLARPDAGTLADVTSCPGAETCRLAVTQSRGLGRLLGDFLRERPDLVAAVPELALKISGCPNGCGQHHVAGIGFQGSLRKLDGRAVPQYFVMLGGDASGESTRFARLVAKLPARRVPMALERLIELYRDEGRDGESAADFFSRVSRERAHAVLADLEALTPEEARPQDYVDLGETRQFERVVMDGECSA